MCPVQETKYFFFLRTYCCFTGVTFGQIYLDPNKANPNSQWEKVTLFKVGK